MVIEKKKSKFNNLDEYIVIKNPFDVKEKKYKMGQREVIVGPRALCLNYSESIEEDKRKVHILSKNQALRLMALADHEDKAAGSIWQVVGECRFIPNKYTQVLKPINAIMINEGEGIYVKNVETSAKKLVKGPCAYLLEANEELYNKPYSDMERQALTLPAQATYEATVVRLQKGEIMCVLDAEKNEHMLAGPLNYLLSPEEAVKVLWLSAGKPKKPKQIKAAKIRTGPDFMSDRFEVRTKDNAQLSLLLTYKWEFLVDKEESFKVFALPDFIGYACTTLCSRIREEAAKFTFEEFHGKTVGLIRKCMFQDHDVAIGKSGKRVKAHGLLFEEQKLLISEVDVKDSMYFFSIV